eukprot:3499336-Prymnesium_polylepis.1
MGRDPSSLLGPGASSIRRIGRHRARGHPAEESALLLSSPSAMTGGRLGPLALVAPAMDLHTPREGG